MIEIAKIQIPGMETKKPRRLYVYTPADYESSGKSYPVLYMFDGHNVFYDSHATYGRSWGMREYLKKSKAELIIAAVECNPEGFRRLFEYSPWSFKAPRPICFVEGLGRETMEWFVNELKPLIDAKYRTLPEREHTMIAGSSMGGLMSLYAILEYNAVFSRAAVISPSLWVSPSGLSELIKSRPLEKPTRIYMDLGSGETKDDPRAAAYLFRTAERLSKAGAHVAARIVPEAMHNEEAWEKRIPIFMDYLAKDM